MSFFLVPKVCCLVPTSVDALCVRFASFRARFVHFFVFFFLTIFLPNLTSLSSNQLSRSKVPTETQKWACLQPVIPPAKPHFRAHSSNSVIKCFCWRIQEGTTHDFSFVFSPNLLQIDSHHRFADSIHSGSLWSSLDMLALQFCWPPPPP